MTFGEESLIQWILSIKWYKTDPQPSYVQEMANIFLSKNQESKAIHGFHAISKILAHPIHYPAPPISSDVLPLSRSWRGSLRGRRLRVSGLKAQLCVEARKDKSKSVSLKSHEYLKIYLNRKKHQPLMASQDLSKDLLEGKITHH